jgi:hypothetical protein
VSEAELESAVGIFDALGNLKSLLSFGEFDAVLFRAVPLVELADAEVNCAYVTMDAELNVAGAVFFALRTDADGYVADFSLPLDRLLAAAEAAGYPAPPVVARASCPVPEYQGELWQPDAEAVQALLAAVRGNAVGLYRRARQHAAAPPAMPPEVDTPSMQGLLSELERAREEITRLRSALRHEQDRNRRLQDALLGGRHTER